MAGLKEALKVSVWGTQLACAFVNTSMEGRLEDNSPIISPDEPPHQLAQKEGGETI